MCISVCGTVCMCINTADTVHTLKIMKKKKSKGRQKVDDITNQGCSLDTTRLHLYAHNTLTILFSTTEQVENRDSVWCQSEGKHPLFKAREERMYQLYRGRVIPLRKNCASMNGLNTKSKM